MSELYSEQVMDHFLNPRNVGEIPDADGVGQVGNPVCGDVMRIYFKLDDAGRIADVKFKTFGCGAAIATSSMITELVKGKTLAEAMEISNKTVAEALGGLPARKMHCSNLAADALLAAVNDYRMKNGLPPIGEVPADGDHHHEHGEDEADEEAAAEDEVKPAPGSSCTLRVDKASPPPA